MRLEEKFELLKKKKEKAFMAHVYCGDPSIEFSERLIKALENGGIDILELGIPFSDPIADGKVFMQACQRALDNKIRPEHVFLLAKKLRKNGFNMPIILTTYYNIIYQKGIANFVDKLAECQIQGVIVPDLPLEESGELKKECDKKGIHLIYLIAPTTTYERIGKILEAASGFVYVVSVTGVTGTSKKAKENIKETVKKIRKLSSIPLLIGFGIAKPEHINNLKDVDVNGYIVGSEICRLYQKEGSEKEKLERIELFAKEIKEVCK